MDLKKIPIQEIIKLYYEFKDKMYKEGITNEDYDIMKKYENDLNIIAIRTGNGQIRSIKEELSKLNYLIDKEKYFYKFQYSDKTYIEENTYVLPLVIANDKENRLEQQEYFDSNNFNFKLKQNRFAGANRYMFICHFHREVTPSMAVEDLIFNRLVCYGCAKNYINDGYGRASASKYLSGIPDAVYYLTEYEDLTEEEAYDLLAQIYLFNIENPNKEFSNLALKYRKAITGDDYKVALETGKKRLQKYSDEELFKIYHKKVNIEDEYNKRYKMIERIRNGKYDENFVYQGPQKVIKLERK